MANQVVFTNNTGVITTFSVCWGGAESHFRLLN